jgi:putative two-component system response regulator
MRALIADDDLTGCAILQEILAHEGVECDIVHDGDEALRALESKEIQLALIDWEMPGLSGPELCRRVRSEISGRYVYLILVTGRDSSSDIVEGLGAGADDYVRKPYSQEELAVRIRAGIRVASLETRDVTIFAMARLAESRDPETGAHLERVRAYCRALAEEMRREQVCKDQVDAEFVQLIYQTSPLHDIGKIGIPDAILLKPDHLSDAEYQIMKSHAQIGFETLDAAARQFPTAKFLSMARDIAISHHERWDGTGYPRGLKGEAIPLCGRVVAVADVYDALSSKRVYKAALPHETARDIILKGAGTHFDPTITGIFAMIDHKFREIRERFADEDPAHAHAPRLAA